MAQNFFSPTVSKALLLRLEKLSSEMKPQWGILNPSQMLRHLQLENDLALGNYKGPDYSNFFREKAFKLVIAGKMPLPTIFSKLRLVPAIPELDVVKSKIEVDSFETEKEKLFFQFRQLLQCENLANLHPAIGKMTKEEWGLFYAWHTDYHLKQFNL
jgi:oxepin-CoA hydrolase / 3-oxo-5,6-dehydrosuberyl-CoA semialdehyde dehydrogenase